MKLLVLDGNSILNRAFYGIKLLTTKDGLFTNGIYGFLTMLSKIESDVLPDGVAIAFDLKAPTFRHKAYDGYKAKRKGMPDELAQQMPILKELLGYLGYKIVECEGYEADDILGTLALACEISDNTCILATGDRDSLQLVNDKTNVRLVTTKFGATQTTLFDNAKIMEEFGVTPLHLIDIKAIQGDVNGGLYEKYGAVKTQAFFHIPLVEMKDAWTEFVVLFLFAVDGILCKKMYIFQGDCLIRFYIMWHFF